jgi:hypothetical protein
MTRQVHPKVAAGGVGGAASVLIVFGLASVGVIVPPEVASAITVLLSVGAGLLRSG